MPESSNILHNPPNPLFILRVGARIAHTLSIAMHSSHPLWRPRMSPTSIAFLNQYLDSNGGDDGALVTPIDGLFLMRSTCERLPYHVMYKPALCITVQGAKQVLF